MADELCTEVCDIVQEAVIKKCKWKRNAKCLSKEASKIAEKRRKLKAKEKRRDIPI